MKIGLFLTGIILALLFVANFGMQYRDSKWRKAEAVVHDIITYEDEVLLKVECYEWGSAKVPFIDRVMGESLKYLFQASENFYWVKINLSNDQVIWARSGEDYSMAQFFDKKLVCITDGRSFVYPDSKQHLKRIYVDNFNVIAKEHYSELNEHNDFVATDTGLILSHLNDGSIAWNLPGVDSWECSFLLLSSGVLAFETESGEQVNIARKIKRYRNGDEMGLLAQLELTQCKIPNTICIQDTNGKIWFVSSEGGAQKSTSYDFSSPIKSAFGTFESPWVLCKEGVLNEENLRTAIELKSGKSIALPISEQDQNIATIRIEEVDYLAYVKNASVEKDQITASLGLIGIDTDEQEYKTYTFSIGIGIGVSP